MKNVAITTKRLWRKRNEAKSGPRGGHKIALVAKKRRRHKLKGSKCQKCKTRHESVGARLTIRHHASKTKKKKKERERNLNTKWRRVFWCITFNIFVLFQWFIYFGAFQRPTCRRSVWQVTSRPPFCQTAFFVFDEWRHKSCFWQ